MSTVIKGRLEITQEFELAAFVDQGTFEEASAEIAAVLQLLEANGIAFEELLPPEQHRHDAAGHHVHLHEFSRPR